MGIYFKLSKSCFQNFLGGVQEIHINVNMANSELRCYSGTGFEGGRVHGLRLISAGLFHQLLAVFYGLGQDSKPSEPCFIYL